MLWRRIVRGVGGGCKYLKFFFGPFCYFLTIANFLGL